jgi:hypothetical protein
MTDRELMDKAWDYLASYTVGERPNASEVNDFIAVIEDRMNQPEQKLMIDCPRCGHCCPQWVWLTDDEIKEIIGPWGDTPIKGYTRKLFDQIENKLREKNT